MNITQTDKIQHGIACFTFDDSQFVGWKDALALFRQYHAHATFFVHGAIGEAFTEDMRLLSEAGHSVGLHTQSHADAPAYFDKYGEAAYLEKEVLPQLLACRAVGLPIHSFAYPNNLRDERTDLALKPYFNRFRAGIGNATEDEIFVPIARLGEQIVMHGYGIGEYYHTIQDELTEKLRHAAETNTCVTFFSHSIAPQAKSIHMPTELLEHCLRVCEQCEIKVLGFDEL